MLVVLYGPDGAGKTTAAQLLASHLRRRGYKTSYLKLKSHHLLAYAILKLLQAVGRVPRSESPRLLDYRLRELFKGSKTHLAVELLSILLWIAANVHPRLALKRVVIADRYTPDSIASLTLVHGQLSGAVLKVLLAQCRKAAVLYMYADAGTLLDRKKDENLSRTYLRYTVRLYDRVALILSALGVNVARVNTSANTRAGTLKTILERIEPQLPVRKEAGGIC
jgi:thymidylate kinase